MIIIANAIIAAVFAAAMAAVPLELACPACGNLSTALLDFYLQSFPNTSPFAWSRRLVMLCRPVLPAPFDSPLSASPQLKPP
jgi:hypothetical protein